MPMTDDIIKKLWVTKDEIARECRYNIDVLAQRLKDKEKASGRKSVDLTSRRKKVLA